MTESKAAVCGGVVVCTLWWRRTNPDGGVRKRKRYTRKENALGSATQGVDMAERQPVPEMRPRGDAVQYRLVNQTDHWVICNAYALICCQTERTVPHSAPCTKKLVVVHSTGRPKMQETHKRHANTEKIEAPQRNDTHGSSCRRMVTHKTRRGGGLLVPPQEQSPPVALAHPAGWRTCGCCGTMSGSGSNGRCRSPTVPRLA